MKRMIAVCMLACFMLTGCMMPKKDYSSVFERESRTVVLLPCDVSENENTTEVGTQGDKAVKGETEMGTVYDSPADDAMQEAHEDEYELELQGLTGISGSIGQKSDEAAEFASYASKAGKTSDNKKDDKGVVEKEISKKDKTEKGETDRDKSEKGETDRDKSEKNGTGKDKTEKEVSGKDKTDKDKTEKDKKEKTFEELAPTVNMSFDELVGDNGVYGIPKALPEPGTYRIVVDLYHQVVMAYSKDAKGKYTVPVRYMLCSSGANSSQSPTGTFRMKNYRVRYALFNNTTSYAQYWSLITGRIYFHSILYTDRDASTYTESYKKLGTNVSHGCIRLTVPDARWIWYNCAPDTEVEIRKGSKSDKETAAIREKLVLADYPSEKLKLKAGKIPWTDNWTIEDVPQEVKYIQGSQ